MKRKVVQNGPLTLGISLPIKWIKLHGIKKGDDVELEEQEKKLLINPSKSAKKDKKATNFTIDTNYKQYIKLIITNAYRIGYDVINISFKTQKQFNLIKDVVSTHLIGYEITEKKKDYCKIESITEPPEDKVETLINRMFHIIKDSSGMIAEYLTKGINPDLRYIESQTNKIDQYTFFCKRTISKTDFEEKSYFRWILLLHLLWIQHDYNRLISYVIHKKVKSRKEFIAVFDKVDKYFESFVEAFIKKDIQAFSRINEKGESILYKDCYSLFENNKEGASLYHLADIVRNVYLASVPAIGIFMSYKPSKVE